MVIVSWHSTPQNGSLGSLAIILHPASIPTVPGPKPVQITDWSRCLICYEHLVLGSPLNIRILVGLDRFSRLPVHHGTRPGCAPVTFRLAHLSYWPRVSYISQTKMNPMDSSELERCTYTQLSLSPPSWVTHFLLLFCRNVNQQNSSQRLHPRGR